MATVRSLCRSSLISQYFLTRSLSTSSSSCYAVESVAKGKSVPDGKSTKQILLKLRKDTGFPLAKCKQALVKFDYDFDQALEEMKSNALKEGWSKMSMLSGRETSQGLVSAQRSGKYATLLEINCESDFVAKTSEFQSFVGLVSQTVIDHLSKDVVEQAELSSEEILSLPIESKSQTINDALATTIGKLKENIKVSKGIFVSIGESNDEFIGVYTHPDLQTPAKGGKLPLMGRYAALVKMRTRAPETSSSIWLQSKARDLAQHIVGMNPSCIGNRAAKPNTVNAPNTVETGSTSASALQTDSAVDSSMTEESDKEQSQLEEEEEQDLEEEYFNNEISSVILEDSDQLLHQPYLLDPNITVQNWLDIHRLEVLYFIRYQLGGGNA